MPVRDREERRRAERRCEPHADDQWSSSEAIGSEADRDEACSGDDIADEEHEADVRWRRAQIFQEQRKERAEKAEPDPPEDLGDGEGAGFLAEA